MKVKLVRYTPEPELLCAKAMRSCRKKEALFELELEKPKEYYIRLAKKTKHYSVLEHATFTFSIKGVSRITTHQIVRHRIASYSQQSLRIIKPDTKDNWCVIPETLSKNDKQKFKSAIDSISVIYDLFKEHGVPQEDARYVLPMGTKTNITVTMNARELLHFFKLRLHPPAQWEINKMAKKMLVEVKKVAPTIFEGVK